MTTISSTQGDRADFPGLGTRYLLRGEATGGRFALIEHDIPPRTLAAPVLKPRGISHAFWNAAEEPARLLELISPALSERHGLRG